MSVYEKLLKVQQETKCNKGQFNSFGKYKYRNVEDIWEAVKPVAAKYGAVLTCTDTITHIGDRYYVEAVAMIVDAETGDAHSTKAYAREDEAKKGMDGAQITGTASSYARKYAMGGLLGLDDTKDSDYVKGIDPDQEQTPIERPEKDVVVEMALTRNQIMAMADGDINRINTFIEKLTKGQFKSTDGMTLDQLRTVKVAIAKAKGNESK